MNRESGIMNRETEPRIRNRKRRGSRRGLFVITCLFLASVLLFFSLDYQKKEARWSGKENAVIVIDGTTPIRFPVMETRSIGELLEKNGVTLRDEDIIFPAREMAAVPGTHVIVKRAQAITILADGQEKKIFTQEPDVERAIAVSGTTLDEDDIVKPARESATYPGVKIAITRVEVREEVIEKAISFAKKVNEDDKLSWRKTIVTKKGEKGVEKLTYRISSHDGKEVNRKLLKREVVKEPVTEVTTQGTYVKLGKSHKGAASWYAWTGTMAAANPWLPKGSYVKVTNVDNGKSVIVVINDRGPFVPGRIIDLDKVAFAKIASIGAGVINVKMEEIVN